MPQKDKTDLAQEGKDIVKKIDNLIESCKKAIAQGKVIHRHKEKLDWEKEWEEEWLKNLDNKLDLKNLKNYITHIGMGTAEAENYKHFGFKSCVYECANIPKWDKNKKYESYKKYYTRAKNGKASEGDIANLKSLYEEMNRYYGSAELFRVPPLPSNTTLIPQSLRDLLRKASKEFDNHLEKEQNK